MFYKSKTWEKNGIKYGWGITTQGVEGNRYNAWGWAEKESKRVSKTNSSWGYSSQAEAIKKAVRYKNECLEFFTKGIKHFGVD